MYEKLKCPVGAKKLCKKLIIRDIEYTEKDKVMDIFKKSFPHVFDKEKDFWMDLLDISPTLVLQMNDGIVCASNIRRTQLIRNRNTSWIDLIACDPDHRGNGFGRILLDKSESLMRNMDAKKAKLHTEESNTNAVGFYSRNGWRVVDHTKWGYSHDHQLTMEKIL